MVDVWTHSRLCMSPGRLGWANGEEEGGGGYCGLICLCEMYGGGGGESGETTWRVEGEKKKIGKAMAWVMNARDG